MLELGKKKRKSKAVNFDMDDDMEIKDDGEWTEFTGWINVASHNTLN